VAAPSDCRRLCTFLNVTDVTRPCLSLTLSEGTFVQPDDLCRQVDRAEHATETRLHEGPPHFPWRVSRRYTIQFRMMPSGEIAEVRAVTAAGELTAAVMAYGLLLMKNPDVRIAGVEVALIEDDFGPSSKSSERLPSTRRTSRW
jgi:hypothetical protein